MERSRVALLRCDGYDSTSVSRAVATGIDLLGGVERFVAREERILLKPNVLAGDDPMKLVSPHPSPRPAVREGEGVRSMASPKQNSTTAGSLSVGPGNPLLAPFGS